VAGCCTWWPDDPVTLAEYLARMFGTQTITLTVDALDYATAPADELQSLALWPQLPESP